MTLKEKKVLNELLDNNLSQFINQARQSGKNDLEIRQALIQQGWQPNQIDPYLNIGTRITTQNATTPPQNTHIIGDVYSQEKFPWPTWSLILFSLLFGLGAGYILVWQNLKRIGLEDVSKKFKIFGFLIALVLWVGLTLAPFIDETSGRSIGNGLALMFPLWFEYKYFKAWRKDNSQKARFSWSILKWAFLGLLISLLMLFIVFVIYGIVYPSS